MFFVESGVAMEKDPQISMSSYTMFAETVKLLKYVFIVGDLPQNAPSLNVTCVCSNTICFTLSQVCTET